MYPAISQALAQERVRDLHNEAIRAHRAGQVRLILSAQRGAHAEVSALLNVRMPESYEDFLRQTAVPVMHEPTASGQTIR
jgi:hypothetical protein